MVCKEDVLLWFKDLESYKRIDLMYELFNMCIPFEIRFLGSCIEEIGKHSFQELRGPSIIANDVERLSKDTALQSGLLDECTRHRTVIYMSVLTSRNCSCANWFYRTLFRTEIVENFVISGCCKDDCILSELLLLFTLCLYHPAFTFEQKLYFGKLIENLIAQSDRNKFSGYNYVAPSRSISSLPIDLSTLPVKTSSIMPVGDALHVQHPPPGLPPIPHHSQQPQIDFIAHPGHPLMTRNVFPTTVVGTPEVPPFPQPPVSPLVTQATSPPQSRASSPHRTFSMRPLSTTNIPPQLMHEAIPNIPPMHLEQSAMLPPTPLQFNSPPPDMVNNKINDEEVNHIPDDKIRDSWIAEQNKQPNGFRIYQKLPFLCEHMQGLKIEGDSSLHCSNSTSSNSSINQSPTETPSVTPAVTPHGPGRGGGGGGGSGSSDTGATNKSRVNGIPPHQLICDMNATPPPPQQVPFSTVPFTMQHPPPNQRYYAQAYRPHFSNPFPYQPNEVFNTIPSPYHLLYSSLLPPAPRNPNCFNCGGMGHAGVDCNGHTVEDITQKPYMLEYDSPTLPDNNPPDK